MYVSSTSGFYLGIKTCLFATYRKNKSLIDSGLKKLDLIIKSLACINIFGNLLLKIICEKIKRSQVSRRK